MINELVTDVSSRLEKANIEYMLSGSIAMGVYTVGRASWDVDVVMDIKEEDIEKFISIFGSRYFLQPDVIKEEIKRSGMFNIIDRETSFKVDFIIKKHSPFREEEFKRRKKVGFLGTQLWIVSIEDLILSKLIWIQELESDVQKRDITSLLLNNSVDKNYIQSWITKLHLNTYNLL
jgi:hypothetical protein